MQAIILTGGKGTRLGLTSKPKPMVIINGKPLLEHTVELLIESGFKEIIFLNGFLSNKIEEYFTKDKFPNIKIKHIKETSPLGTAGCINQVKDILKEWFFIIYGDLLINIDFKKFYKTSIKNGDYGTLFAHPNGHPHDSDLLKVGKDNKINKIFLKPHAKEIISRNVVNAAIYCLNKEIIKYIPNGKKSDWMKDVFGKTKNKIYAYHSSEIVFDVGTKKRIKKARNLLKNNFYGSYRKAVFLDRDGVINHEINGVYKHNDMKLLPGVGRAIKSLNDINILVICITNQPGVAKGFMSEHDLEKIHAKLDFLLGKENAYLDDILYCPHHPEKGWEGEIKHLKINCNCRKPKPKLFKNAIKKHNINEKESFFISDTLKDLEVSKYINITPILVMTGYGKKQLNKKNQNVLYSSSLNSAVTSIILNSK